MPTSSTDTTTGRAPARVGGDTKARILDAAEEVVLRDGVARLTLDAAASEAGLSKGGILYHFPTRDALVAGMVTKIIEEFDRDIEARLAADAGPGSFTRAYIGATMEPSAPRPDREDRLGAALIAAAAAQPDLLAPLQQAADRWQGRLEHDGLDPTVATLLRLACDGLWMCDLFGLAAPTASRRVAVGRTLDQLARETVVTAVAASDRAGGLGGPADGDEGSRRVIRTLSLTVFLQWMGATAIVPMLPEYIRHLGGTDALAGVVMASFFAAGVLSQYPVGRLADRIGRRPVLIAGLLTYGVASFAFLLPITAPLAIVLRSLQGVGAGSATVAALAMVSGSVAVERRGRAFASIYSGELAGMAIGPLVGSIVGVHFMWAMFLVSGLLSMAACVPALGLHEPVSAARALAERTRADGTVRPLHRVRIGRSMTGALICGAALGLASGVYDICWTLLLLARGASGLEIGISWTLFAVPFVLAAKPSGWLADHMDRRVLVLLGIGTSTVLCASYPFIHNVPALVLLGASEALGFAAAMPAMQSLLTQGAAISEVGRIQGMFATSQTACTAVAAAAAGAAFAVASWLPFVSVALISAVSLGVATAVWWAVPGRVDRSSLPLSELPEAPTTPATLAVAVTTADSDQPGLPDAVGASADVQ